MAIPKIENKITYATILNVIAMIFIAVFAVFSFYKDSIYASNSIPEIEEKIEKINKKLQDHRSSSRYDIYSQGEKNEEKYVSIDLFERLEDKVDNIHKTQKETNKLIIKLLNKK